MHATVTGIFLHLLQYWDKPSVCTPQSQAYFFIYYNTECETNHQYVRHNHRHISLFTTVLRQTISVYATVTVLYLLQYWDKPSVCTPQSQFFIYYSTETNHQCVRHSHSSLFTTVLRQTISVYVTVTVLYLLQYWDKPSVCTPQSQFFIYYSTETNHQYVRHSHKHIPSFTTELRQTISMHTTAIFLRLLQYYLFLRLLQYCLFLCLLQYCLFLRLLQSWDGSSVCTPQPYLFTTVLPISSFTTVLIVEMDHQYAHHSHISLFTTVLPFSLFTTVLRWTISMHITAIFLYLLQYCLFLRLLQYCLFLHLLQYCLFLRLLQYWDGPSVCTSQPYFFIYYSTAYFSIYYSTAYFSIYYSTEMDQQSSGDQAIKSMYVALAEIH